MAYSKLRTQPKENNLLYYGLLLYLIVFYTQIAARIPALAPFRVEFIIGSVLVLCGLLRLLRREIDFKENKLNTAALLFLTAAFITIPFAFVKMRALNMFISLFKFFSVYLMIITIIDNEKKLKGFVYLYLAMIALLFVEPFILSLQGEGFIYNNHMMRLAGITGYFKHPNQLGGITAENIPFFYYLMRHDKSKAVKLVSLILMIIGLRVIMLTQSRTAFIGVMIFGLYLLATSKKKVLCSILLILSVLLLWNFAPPETKNRFLTLSNLGDVITYDQQDDQQEFRREDHEKYGSMASRWTLIRRSLIVFAENPVLGVGLDCFISVNGRRWGLWFPPHSTYTQALCEMGIVGTFAFICVVFLTFKNLSYAKSIMKKIQAQDHFIIFMVNALTAYLVVRLAVSFFGIELYANYWWLAGGLSLVVLRVIKRTTPRA